MAQDVAREVSAQLRAEMYRSVGIEPGVRISGSDFAAFEEKIREQAPPSSLVRRQRNPLERARQVPFKAEMRNELTIVDGQERYYFEGIASATDQPYQMWDWAGEYDEIVERGAFTDTLAANPDVAFLMNHRGMTMARTTNATLKLGMVEQGLGVEAWLNPKRSDIAQMITAIDDGLLDEMSFAFMLEEGWWSDDFTTFRISKLDIDRGDVSVVNYGANPFTSIGSRAREILAEVRHLPSGAAVAIVNALTARADVVQLQRRYQASVELHIDELKERALDVPVERSIVALELRLEEASRQS